MSPTSLDALELERYVGACLFTNYRNKKSYNGFANYQQHHHHHQFDQWAGGAPLISFANHHHHEHRGSQNFGDDFTRNQHLTHLAKGAPLILGKPYQHRKSKPSKNNNVVQQTKVFENSTNKKQIEFKNVDNVSVNSDESSGSQNSETCLPRIIRPRKRRKKDRKAPSSTVCSNHISNNFLTTSSVDDREYATFPSFFHYLEPLFQPALLEDLNESPKLHHSFEEVEESQDVNGNQPASTCQCRYCNPEGQIWDIDRTYHSSFLTNTPSFDFSNLLPVASSQHDIYNNLHQELLKLSLNTNKPEFSRSTSSSSSSSFSSSTGDLEVSTEIVTSPNGHRDIEIKFRLSGSDNKSANK